MKEFSELLDVARILNGPDGCPWDRVQTFQTLRTYVLEEAHELLEAVDENDLENIVEELGDLFYTVIFYAKIAEREKLFSLENVIHVLKEKLIRRHPHIFGEEKGASVEEVIHKWDKIKQEEKKERKSLVDGIPKTLPSLQRAQKILERMKKKNIEGDPLKAASRSDELGNGILEIVKQAVSEGVDIESAFREVLKKQEDNLVRWK